MNKKKERRVCNNCEKQDTKNMLMYAKYHQGVCPGAVTMNRKGVFFLSTFQSFSNMFIFLLKISIL
jgi:hypothetical protein